VGIKDESGFVKQLKAAQEMADMEAAKRDAAAVEFTNNTDKLINQRLRRTAARAPTRNLDVQRVIRETERKLRQFWQECVQNWFDVAANAELVTGETVYQGTTKCDDLRIQMFSDSQVRRGAQVEGRDVPATETRTTRLFQAMLPIAAYDSRHAQAMGCIQARGGVGVPP
jgi:hypothetical protein